MDLVYPIGVLPLRVRPAALLLRVRPVLPLRVRPVLPLRVHRVQRGVPRVHLNAAPNVHLNAGQSAGSVQVASCT